MSDSARHDASSFCPPTVRYACVLLSIQASLWAVVSLAVIAVCADPVNWHAAAMRGDGRLALYIGASVAAVALAAGLSTVSFVLAFLLGHGRSKARFTAIGLETCMACFGLLVAGYTGSQGAGIIAIFPVLAGLVGFVLSLIAVFMLLDRSARNFTQWSSRSSATL